MSRYPYAQSTPGQPTLEGDSEFLGMDMETDRWLLPAGQYHFAQNYRSSSGKMTKRKGSILPLWAQPPGRQYGQILGAGLFSDPNGDKQMLIATPAKVWRISSGGYPTEIALPAGVTLSGRIEFAQHFQTFELHRGSGLPTLSWAGEPATGFIVVVKAHPDVTTTQLVPGTEYSVHFAGRKFFPVSKDEFGVTDSGDYTAWDPAGGRKFRANAGSADVMTGLFPYTTGNLVIGKKQSIDVFKGVTGTLEGISAEVVSSEIGIIARRSWKMFGADAAFLSHRGVYRLSQVDQNRLATSPLPVGAYKNDKGRVIDPIAPLLKRINWAAADMAVAGMDGIYYVLAFPIDGSTTNNAILALNTLSDKWEGLDTFDDRAHMQIDELLQFDHNGEQRLFAINHRTNSVHLLNEGKFDETTTGRWEIEHIFESRGYATLGWNAATRRDFKRVELVFSTWRPQLTIEEQTEGANDRRIVAADLTRNRTRYETFGKGKYDTSNVNDDALVPGREDYSVSLVDGEELTLGSGIDLEQKQEWPLRFSTRCRGRYISYRVRCTQGDADILGVLVESDGVQRDVRRAA